VMVVPDQDNFEAGLRCRRGELLELWDLFVPFFYAVLRLWCRSTILGLNSFIKRGPKLQTLDI
jgi:hypothetical protein